ncbi:RES family NAD+ phosphorylase [Nocardioides hwasunensis]|uniref:RES domain-containing protein n=1 Tax=Nocardioides hwasunensis TaxID=397258 RepID=A0ABR8MG81_9ACTN|nr:RES domain-containing protein [Nocardioides hwasunensis]MBD3915087.1 RES domain-containing protein [Nocardioides hwasunensis]
MTSVPDDALLEAVDRIGRTSWSGQTHRYTTARREALSGVGARLFGGRYNPPDLFPTIYLAQPVQACMRELARAAEDRHLTVQELLTIPHVLHTIELVDVQVLDLTVSATQDILGLDVDDLRGEWQPCQAVGHAAWFLEFQGVLAPSAVGAGVTLALFEHRTTPGQVTGITTTPIDYASYESLKRPT